MHPKPLGAFWTLIFGAEHMAVSLSLTVRNLTYMTIGVLRRIVVASHLEAR